MQFKLLNFHKILAKIASNLIACFIVLIVYDATGSLLYAILASAGAKITWFIFDTSFRKLYYKYPQIFLLLRVIPFVALSIFIYVIETNFIVGLIGIIISYGLSDSFRFLPSECLFNYTSGANTEQSNATTRLFEQIGTLLGVVVGGFLLSYMSAVVTIIVATALYVVSVIPLVIYYIMNRKDKFLNAELVSNVAVINEKNAIKSREQKTIIFKVLTSYFIAYLLFCFCDFFTTLLNLYIFFNNPNAYAYLGIAMAFYNGAYGAFGWIYGKMQSRYDTTPLFIACCLTVAFAMVISPFLVGNKILLMYCMVVFGCAYSVVCAFVLNRMLIKTRIMGVSNGANYLRSEGSSFAIIISSFILLAGFMPAFITLGAMLVVSAVYIPANEEYTRKLLVDYIQENSTSKKHTGMAGLSLRPFGKKYIDKSYKEIDKRPGIVVVGAEEKRGRRKKIRTITPIQIKEGTIDKKKKATKESISEKSVQKKNTK